MRRKTAFVFHFHHLPFPYCTTKRRTEDVCAHCIFVFGISLTIFCVVKNFWRIRYKIEFEYSLCYSAIKVKTQINKGVENG